MQKITAFVHKVLQTNVSKIFLFSVVETAAMNYAEQI